jgi:hypothetical protein
MGPPFVLQKYHTVADRHCAIRATVTYISRLPVPYVQHCGLNATTHWYNPRHIGNTVAFMQLAVCVVYTTALHMGNTCGRNVTIACH